MKIVLHGEACHWKRYARVEVPHNPRCEPVWKGLLRRIEWSGTSDDRYASAEELACCPDCREPRDVGLHLPTCQLGALLGRRECLPQPGLR